MEDSSKSEIIKVVNRLKSGDQQAFEELYGLTHNKVYFLALKVLRNREDAMEVVQETYISVYKSIDKLINPEVFNAWLSKIVINKCNDFLGKQKEVLLLENEEYEEIDAIEAIEDTSTDFIPHEALDKAETRNMIMALIDELPAAQRMTLMLHYYQELNVDEIAAIMECPAATVKSRLLYARRQIKNGVEGYEKQGIKLYSVSVAPLITFVLDEFSKQNTIGPELTAKILATVGAGTHIAAAAASQAGTVVTRISLLQKIAALSVKTKIIAGIVAGAVAITAIAAPIAIHARNSKPSLESSFSVTIEKTYSKVYTDDKYGQVGSLDYSRPVFKGTSPAVKKLDDFYDQLEKEWITNGEAAAESDIDNTLRIINENQIDPSNQTISPYLDTVESQIAYDKNDVICVAMDLNIYFLNSLHNNPSRTAHVFEKSTGQELFLTDVLNIDQSNAAPIIIDLFQKLQDSTLGSELYMDRVRELAGLNMKFYLDDKGVWLYFDSAEAGVFACGRIEVCIPYDSDLISSRLTQADTSQTAAAVTEETTVVNTCGNTAGNIANGGIAALQGDWIYYTNVSDNYSLYKIRTNGTDKTQLNSDDSEYINVVGDWIYYWNGNDKGNLYKIRTNGIDKTQLNSDDSEYINVVGDWIYYENNSDNGYLYKMHTDGTGETQLNSDKSMDINVMGDWIYYSNFSDNGYLYKIRIDGTGEIKLNSDDSMDINVMGDWIYYSNNSDHVSLYKIRTDGTGETKMNIGFSRYINVVGDWIYYANTIADYGLYKMRTDGTGETKLNSDNSLYINVVGEWIYYTNYSDNYMYKMRTDGTERQLVQ